MATVEKVSRLLDEISDFFASVPTREQLLNFRPSPRLQRQVEELLAKQNQGRIADDEKRQLDEFVRVELFMRLVKTKVRGTKGSQP